MVEVKKNERANAFKKIKYLCKQFGFIVRMLRGLLAEEPNKKNG
jgi:hypothetical protein